MFWRVAALIEESDWYGMLREELAIEQGFFGSLRAIARVAAHYTWRILAFVGAVAAILYVTIRQNG